MKAELIEVLGDIRSALEGIGLTLVFILISLWFKNMGGRG